MNTFVKVSVAAALIATPVAIMAKKAPAPSGLELQQIQSKDIEASKGVVFGAVMSVLQDSGYRVQAADKDTGLITGIASTSGKMTYNLFWGFGKSKKTPIVSAFIEERTPRITSVRLSFVMAKVKSTIYGAGSPDEEPIYDAAVYSDAFEKINQAVFIRLSADAPASVPAATTTPAAVPVASVSTVVPATSTP
jgi:hypothetical protein